MKKPEKFMEVVNIDEENLHIFWTIWGISIKFPINIWIITILKFKKKKKKKKKLVELVLVKCNLIDS